ncbi:MAG: TerB family tellurite resistance protein [Deltaproteobacteria bacterium]|nr:TerB family tellurite resistance protein [Deltaproteobacteria bacterium]
MENSIFKKLIDEEEGQTAQSGKPSDWDLTVAVATVLYAAIRADTNIDSYEMNKFADIFKTHLDVNDEEVGHSLELAEQLYKSKTTYDKFCAILQTSFNAEERQQIYTAAWKIILSDNKVDPSESAFAVSLRNQLGLSMEQALYCVKALELEKEEANKK